MKHPKHARKTELGAATVGVLGAIALTLALAVPAGMNTAVAESVSKPEKEANEGVTVNEWLESHKVNDFKLKGEWIDLGYSDIFSYWDALIAKREEAVGLTDQAIQTFAGTITDEEIETIRAYEESMTRVCSFASFDKKDAELAAILEAIEARMPKYVAPSYSYSEGGGFASSGVLTRSGGVNWYNGQKETWYSSNRAYHYRTGEWTLGSDGVYRDSDGYIVVASPNGANGEIIETSLGAGKAYDYCPSGSVDIYTAW